jgi:YD repeat-containing protein
MNGSAHPTTFACDLMKRLTGITYPDGSTVGFTYDTRGRRMTSTDQNNKTTTSLTTPPTALTAVTESNNPLHIPVYFQQNSARTSDRTYPFRFEPLSRTPQTLSRESLQLLHPIRR